MSRRLQHRGPDAHGSWCEGPVALSHQRLAIRDLSSAGTQPFASPCGRVVVVYNGEIYNDTSVASRLHRETGFSRQTGTDTEVIPAAYLAWGLEAFAQFEGMFAIALWDRDAKRLVLARDGIGIKPLHVMETAQSFAFASEIKALRVLQGGPVELSAPDVAHMLALGYPGPTRTTVKGIRQLAPGHVLVHERGTVQEHRFWTPHRHGGNVAMSAAVHRVVETLSEVVADQLISDVDVGSLQSGGIDSSLITMSLPSTRNIPLFSVSFPEKSHDEAANVRALATVAHRSVHWIRLADSIETAEDFVACARAVDGQLGDASLLATYQLSRAVRQQVKVALSGDGADEFFGGYETYRATRLAAQYARLVPRSIAGFAASTVRHALSVNERRLTRAEKLYRLAYGVSQPVPHATWRHYLPNDERATIYGAALREELQTDPFAGYATAYSAANGDATDKAMLADQTYYLPGDMLIKIDRASMAHGLEVRVPFLDRRMMELAGGLHTDLLFGPSGGQTKLVLRQALRAQGGPEALANGPKLGFNVPINLLLRGALKPLAERYLDRNADSLSPVLNPDGVRRVWRQHAAGAVDRKYLIWTLLTMAVWLDLEAGT